MEVYFDRDLDAEADGMGRYHPWGGSQYDSAVHYYDFVSHPELIRTALEDVLPIQGTATAESIYSFLEWANGPQSLWETNDSGLRPVCANKTDHFGKALQRSARFSIFVRDLPKNIDLASMHALGSQFRFLMEKTDGRFPACFAYWYWPHLFSELLAAGEPAEGMCLGVTLWAWGNDDTEVEANFVRAMGNLRSALNELQATRWPDEAAKLQSGP